MRSPTVISAGPLVLLLLAGCAAAAPSSELDGAEPAGAASRKVAVSATFTTSPQVAITYAEDLVRVGAHGAVSAQSDGENTTVRLAVRGLVPNRTYGAHAHALPCGADGAAAGPHFQHEPDPQQPSTDPAFANPENEVWLDVGTDADGAGTAEATLPWVFSAPRPRSVVIHADPTSTAPGAAGTAGHRAACINVEF